VHSSFSPFGEASANPKQQPPPHRALFFLDKPIIYPKTANLSLFNKNSSPNKPSICLEQP
jgi:hypothetical protein